MNLNYLMNKCRETMQRNFYYPPLIFENGMFEISGVPENDVSRITNTLHTFDWIISNSVRSSWKYDFCHFTPMGQPKRKFTISGQIDFSKVDGYSKD